jgi:DNA-binding transcriptional MerR regulator
MSKVIHFPLKMAEKYLRTSDLARAVGVHPNTVRMYVKWGLVPPVKRSPSGYRLFTKQHLNCLRLARMIYASVYPGRDLRASSKLIIDCAVAGDWQEALEKAQGHAKRVKAELAQANQAADLLQHWAKKRFSKVARLNLAIGEVSRRLGVAIDVIRNWERNGFISIPRNPLNGYRIFGQREIKRLHIIRMLSKAGYSHMAILRMFLQLDSGNARDLKKALDTPREDEDIFLAADHWLTTLQGQKKVAQQVISMVKEIMRGINQGD